MCITAEPLVKIAGYLSTSTKIIEKHYGHHRPDHQKSIGEAFTKGTAGRTDFGREAKVPEKPNAANNPAIAAEVRRSIRDLLNAFKAPVITFNVLAATPDVGLEGFREQVMRCGDAADWSAILKHEDA